MVDEAQELTPARKRGSKAIKIAVATVAVLILLGGMILLSALKQPPAFKFLTGAQVVHTEEWIESSKAGGWGRLKTGGIYRLPGTMETVAEIVRHDLTAPTWHENAKPTTVSFEKENQYVTLQDHPSDGHVTVFIQTYRTPSVLDRIRLWYNRNFASKGHRIDPEP